MKFAGKPGKTAHPVIGRRSLKRSKMGDAEKPYDWLSENPQGLYPIRDFVEFKTTCHPDG